MKVLSKINPLEYSSVFQPKDYFFLFKAFGSFCRLNASKGKSNKYLS